ncbi:MAG: glycosyltransferase family 39 protein [Patescibacteria group bacterium]
MPFYGDIGWFYLSARDLLLGKGFPLVGITSSHTWLHQGPLWTYFLSVALWLGNFDPLAGGYLSILLGILTVYCIYYIGKRMFSERVGVIAAFLYSLSPLVILNIRTPYHTTPIPIFALLYFMSIYLWVKGQKSFLGFSLFFLAILYNLELATVILVVPMVAFLMYGLWQKKSYTKKIGKTDAFKAFLLGLIPMLPILIYDVTHGFKQTLIYGGWLFYSFTRGLLGFLYGSSDTTEKIEVLNFLYSSLRSLIFFDNGLIALLLLGISFLWVAYLLFRQYKQSRINPAYVLVIFWFLLTVSILILNGVASDAYLPQLYPAIFLILALGADSLHRISPKLPYFIIIVVFIFNIHSVITHNYFMAEGEGIPLSSRQAIANEMISKSDSKAIIIKGEGIGSQFRSFTMPYEYLVWYYDPGRRVGKSSKLFIVSEREFRINLDEKYYD